MQPLDAALPAARGDVRRRFLIVQIDGLSRALLDRALAGGSLRGLRGLPGFGAARQAPSCPWGCPRPRPPSRPRSCLGFSYDDEYTVRADPTPLSLSLPVLSNRHRDKAVRAYLEGLLPDSEGARQRWAREYHVSPNNPFALLAHVGRDAAGAVQILTS